jgi:excisionase family DNA binding protein
MSSPSFVPPPASDRLIGTYTAARKLKVPARTVRYWAAHGVLPAVRIGKLWKFSLHEISSSTGSRGGGVA